MKTTNCLLLYCLVTVLVLGACASEEERRMGRMIDSLDSAWAIHGDAITRFFNSVDQMKASVKPVKVYGPGEESQLSEDAAAVWAKLGPRTFGGLAAGSEGKLQTRSPLVLGTNAYSIRYDAAQWEKGPIWFFREWYGMIPALHLEHIYDHLKTEKWSEVFYGDDGRAIDGDDADAFLRKGLKMMEHLPTVQYLVVIQPVLILPAEVAGGQFEGGAALGQVKFWDVAKSAFAGQAWVKAVNSYSVFTTVFEGESKDDALRDELPKDLMKNLHVEVKEKIQDVVEGGKAEYLNWD
ncbi:MAG: hypothetical protein AAGN35_10980 [Bacteroidota bacterium]